jgi:hypothetical protein
MPNMSAMTPEELEDLRRDFLDLGVKLSLHTRAMEEAGYSRREAMQLTAGFQTFILGHSSDS